MNKFLPEVPNAANRIHVSLMPSDILSVIFPISFYHLFMEVSPQYSGCCSRETFFLAVSHAPGKPGTHSLLFLSIMVEVVSV